MKQGLESAPQEVPLPPKVRIIESGLEGKTVERQLQSIPDEHVRSPESMRPLERTEAFEQAYKMIVDNKKLERLVVKSFVEQKYHRTVTSFAELMNRLSEICVSLSDQEIENITRKFKSGLLSRLSDYVREFELSGKDTERLQTVAFGTGPQALLNARGIAAPAHFMRARKKLHAVGSDMAPAFYFDNYLDASHKIDLIEVLKKDDGVVLNLIQIKSSDLSEEEIESIAEAHKKWLSDSVMNLSAYERNFSLAPENAEELEKFFTDDVLGMEEAYMDILTMEHVPTVQDLFKRLGIDTLSKPERFWLLKSHLPRLRIRAKNFGERGVADPEQLTVLGNIFDEIEKQIKAVEQQKKDLLGIIEVHSICAVQAQEVSDHIIFKAETGKGKAVKWST